MEAFNSVHDMLAERAETVGDRAAVAFEREKRDILITYKELYLKTQHLGTFLTKKRLY